jgi:hypothetical protein
VHRGNPDPHSRPFSPGAAKGEAELGSISQLQALVDVADAVPVMVARDCPVRQYLTQSLIRHSHPVIFHEGKNNMIALPEGLTADKNTYPPDAAGFWFTNKDQFPPFATWTPAYVQHRKDIVDKGFLVATPFVAFSASTDEVKTEVANANQTMVQYLQPLWIGISDNVDASFATLDQKLKAAGVEKLRTTFQSQVDAYMKRF